MMGSVFRKTVTKPLPKGAEIFVRKGERFARWKDRKGKTKTVPVTVGQDGSDRIAITSGTYTAKYRDGDGILRETKTGCRSRDGALSVLRDLTNTAEKVKAKILTSDEAKITNHQSTPLTEHIKAYITYLTPRANTDRVNSTESRLNECAEACNWHDLSSLNADRLQTYLDQQVEAGMSAGSANGRIECCVAFGNWLAGKRMNGKKSNWNGDKRITKNPFEGFGRYDAKVDCRRKRRALTENEMIRLLQIARQRPLNDAMTIRRGENKGKLLANVTDEQREKLILLGRERALIYKTLVLTGLRKNEIASIKESQLFLDHDPPYLDLQAADEKNSEGNDIVLRADLSEELREWLRLKVRRRREFAADDANILSIGKHEAPAGTDEPLFYVPSGLLRILDRDLAAAKIPKKDERSRTVDLHAMRHTFGTWLSKGGVAPRTAQAAMRHSHIDLTMNTYTDPRALDIQGAVESLPSLATVHANENSATGTDDSAPRKFAPGFAPTTGNLVQTVTNPDKNDRPDNLPQEAENACNHEDLQAFSKSGRKDLNLRPLRPELTVGITY